MKMNKLFTLLALLMVFASCNDANRENEAAMTEEEMWDPDESMDSWIDSWNKNDAQSLKDVTSSDAVLLLDGVEVSSDSIDSWFDNSSAMMKNLTTNSLIKNSSKNIAYQSGTYRHQVKENDTMEFSGTYTVIWEKEESGMSSDTAAAQNNWKIKLMDIAEERPMDTTSVENE